MTEINAYALAYGYLVGATDCCCGGLESILSVYKDQLPEDVRKSLECAINDLKYWKAKGDEVVEKKYPWTAPGKRED